MWRWDGTDWDRVSYRCGPDEEMPARCGHTACVWINRKHKAPCIIFFGGDISGRGTGTDDLWIYSITSSKWMRIDTYGGSAPPPRFGHSACVFEDDWMLISGGYSSGWFSSYTLTDMHTYNLLANCWFSIELIRPSAAIASLSNLVYVKSTRSIYSLGSKDEGAPANSASSDVYLLCPLITYTSFSAMRHQVESINNVLSYTFDSISEEIGRTIRKIDMLANRLEAIECTLNSSSSVKESAEGNLKRTGAQAKGLGKSISKAKARSRMDDSEVDVVEIENDNRRGDILKIDV